jgi:hypothetical protein
MWKESRTIASRILAVCPSPSSLNADRKVSNQSHRGIHRDAASHRAKTVGKRPDRSPAQMLG